MLLCGVGCANLPPFASASATDGCMSCYGAPVCYTQSKRKVRAQGVTFNPSLTTRRRSLFPRAGRRRSILKRAEAVLKRAQAKV